MTHSSLIVALTAILCVAFAMSLDYSEIQSLGVSCPSRDTCTANVTRTVYSTSCECDVKCSQYGDCCIDAVIPRNLHILSSSSQVLRTTCLPLSNEEGVYVISRCKSSWSGGEDVRQQCENLNSFENPLISVPATDQRLNVTYRNRYCALCNDARGDLISWAISLNFDSLITLNSTYRNVTEKYILNNLVYENNSWGVNLWNPEEGQVSFYATDVIYQKPTYLTPNVRYCRANVISTCSPGFNRAVIRTKCNSYMAVLYFNRVAYRNAHCALCNNLNLKTHLCDLGIRSRQPPSASLSMMIDINSSDGNLVGVRKKCRSNQKYDPFYKRCLTLVCGLPGFVLRNGNCVRS